MVLAVTLFGCNLELADSPILAKSEIVNQQFVVFSKTDTVRTTENYPQSQVSSSLSDVVMVRFNELSALWEVFTEPEVNGFLSKQLDVSPFIQGSPELYLLYYPNLREKVKAVQSPIRLIDHRGAIAFVKVKYDQLSVSYRVRYYVGSNIVNYWATVPHL